MEEVQKYSTSIALQISKDMKSKSLFYLQEVVFNNENNYSMGIEWN